jgi:hypothetical protein
MEVFELREESSGSLHQVSHLFMLENNSENVAVGFVEEMSSIHRQEPQVWLEDLEEFCFARVAVFDFVPIVKDEVAVEE